MILIIFRNFKLLWLHTVMNDQISYIELALFIIFPRTFLRELIPSINGLQTIPAPNLPGLHLIQSQYQCHVTHLQSFFQFVLPFVWPLVDLSPLPVEQADVVADLFNDMSRFLFRSHFGATSLGFCSNKASLINGHGSAVGSGTGITHSIYEDKKLMTNSPGVMPIIDKHVTGMTSSGREDDRSLF